MLPLIALAAKLLPLASAVPEVLRAFGGEKQGEVAERLVGAAKALSGEPDGEKAVEKVLADPALHVRLQESLINERLEYRRLELAETKAYLDDTQGARERDQKLRELGYRNIRANTMLGGAGLLIVIILAIIVAVSPLDDFVKSTLLLILGRALGYVDQGFNFEFGTTRSSSKKDDTISQMAKGG